MKRATPIPFIMVLSLFSSLAAGADAPVVVSNAWIREAPPAAKVLAAYMNVENTTAGADAITAVASDQFEKAEMHRTQIKNGVASMEQVTQMVLPAHETVKFEPNGSHIMLINPKVTLRAGQHVKLQLTFRNTASVTVNAEVRNAMAAGDEHQHHHE